MKKQMIIPLGVACIAVAGAGLGGYMWYNQKDDVHVGMDYKAYMESVESQKALEMANAQETTMESEVVDLETLSQEESQKVLSKQRERIEREKAIINGEVSKMNKENNTKEELETTLSVELVSDNKGQQSYVYKAPEIKESQTSESTVQETIHSTHVCPVTAEEESRVESKANSNVMSDAEAQAEWARLVQASIKAQAQHDPNKPTQRQYDEAHGITVENLEKWQDHDTDVIFRTNLD